MRLFQSLMLLAAIVSMSSGVAQAITVGEALPSLKVIRPDSGADAPLETSGKVTVVNFWATWCESCKVEIKEMKEKFATLIGQKDFQMAFVALDKEPKKAAAWFRDNLKDEAFLTHLYADPTFKIADQLEVDSFPMTLIIGKDGKVAHIQKGFDATKPTTDEIKTKANALLTPMLAH